MARPVVFFFVLTVDDKPCIFVRADKVPDCLHEAASIGTGIGVEDEDPASLHALGGATDELLEIIASGVDPDLPSKEEARWIFTGALRVTLRRKEPLWRRHLSPASGEEPQASA